MKCRKCGKDAVGIRKIKEITGHGLKTMSTIYYEGLCEEHLKKYITSNDQTEE